MARPVITLTGDRKVDRMLSALTSTQAKKVIRQSAKKAVKQILQPKVKALAPVATRTYKYSTGKGRKTTYVKGTKRRPGALKRAITTRLLPRSRQQIGARITFKKPWPTYGGPMEWGWLATGRKGRKGYGLGRKQRTMAGVHRIEGRFFMARAVKQTKRGLLRLFRLEVGSELTKLAKATR